VYILSGEDPGSPSQEIVYVGESDNVWTRLTSHNTDRGKDFWQRTVVITSKDENLTKSHVRYLEGRLIQIARQAQRVKLSNNTTPEASNLSLPEPDKADMEYFLEQIQMLLPVLGHTFASPLPNLRNAQNSPSSQSASPVFYINFAGVNASAQEVNNEFVILKDSTMRKSDVPSLSDSYRQIRNQLYNDGKLADSPDENYWVFTQDVPFSSPSTAASVVTGTGLNGRDHWKLKGSGKSYKEWLEAQVEQVQESDDDE
jgi:hypothetical protein